MQCGAECFLVEIEVNGEKQTKQVKARTPVAARKPFGQHTEQKFKF